MIEKDPANIPALTYLWVIILASLGGLVAFIRRLNQQNKPEKLSIVFIKLFGEILVSAFAGIITFYLCEYFAISQLLTAVFVAVSGHMGGNAIDLITKRIIKYMEKYNE